MTAATAETPSTSVVEDPPFKKTEPMAYAMGDIGNGFYFQLVTNYALIYMTDALGINPVIAGMIIFVGKLISAFTDFGTGVWADNAPLRKDGRYQRNELIGDKRRTFTAKDPAKVWADIQKAQEEYEEQERQRIITRDSGPLFSVVSDEYQAQLHAQYPPRPGGSG